LAHIYAQAVELEVLTTGGRVGYARGPVDFLLDDIKHLQPTIMTAVPRILYRVADVMKKEIAKLPWFLRWIMEKAMADKVRSMTQNRSHSLFLDAILFSKFRAALGGRLRLIVSGGAAIMPETLEFMCAVVTPNILQGCGMTELSSACFVQELPVSEIDTVGNVCPTCEVKLRCVPEMPEYDPQGPEPAGEALARGANLFQGYYKQEELTREAMVDGWFATGDIVRVTKGMQMKIIDRVKQLVKLCQGEYVSLTTLTEYYQQADVAQFVFVHAEGKYDQPVAIVWPKQDYVEAWRARGILDIEHSQIVCEEVVASLQKVYETRKMNGYERIRHVLISLEEPTQENGLLTPSLKAQLKKIQQKYQRDLDQLYESFIKH
jgi:long-chain acyl-CoA synthetase